MVSKSKKEKHELSIKEKKEDNFSEWYTEIIQKGDLMEYTNVSGCIVFKPRSYYIWEKIQEFLNKEMKRNEVKNAYFPLFIPESLLNKEEDHVEGFTPEVAWVTEAGDSKLKERLAVRPTSETIMYDSYRKWIRSYKDLPLKINQWNNVVRWEFKHPTPFLRTREFLWQEGHNVFSTKEECEKDTLYELEMYKKAFEELLAVPVIPGRKSEKEKFAGADYTYSLEALFPDGKSIQASTSHMLGQNFSKAFDIKFTDENQDIKYAWQNSWGFTTRTIGIMISIHSDNKGLVLPPRVADTQIVIVPILKKGKEELVLNKAKEIKEKLNNFNVILDDRDYTPGFKFNEWELKGVSLRIEIGPKDVESNSVIAVKRNTFEKIIVSISKIESEVKELLDEIQKELYEVAKKKLDESIVVCDTEEEFKEALNNKKLPLVKWCTHPDCEEKIKDEYGAKSNNIPFKQPKKVSGKCAFCNREAKAYTLINKSY